MRQQSGFTLIELVVVIVILGILAAFAVPRFVGMQEEARRSAMEGLQGSLHGAASLAHGKQLAAEKGPDISIEASGKTITMDGGWPSANSSGIVRMIQDTSGYNIISDPSSCNSSLGGTLGNPEDCERFYPAGRSSGNCYIDYSANGSSYEVNSTLSNCG
jgi:MSHA pilin protein MshA